jgi:transposase
MRRVAAKLLPRLLTGAQKRTVSQSGRSCLIVPMPPYFPDLVPADFFLFPKLKSSLKGRRFQTVEEIEKNSPRNLRAIPQNTFQDAFQNWKKRWERCIKSGGECFEGDKFD